MRTGKSILGDMRRILFIFAAYFVEIMVDTTQKCEELLPLERLFAWHYALFPTGRNKLHKIQTLEGGRSTNYVLKG